MKILSTCFDIMIADRKTLCFCEIISVPSKTREANDFVLGGGQDELYSNKHIAICKDCRGHCFVLHKRNQSEGKYTRVESLLR